MLLMDAVVSAHEIEATDAEVEAKIAEMAEKQGAAPDVLERAHRDDELKRALRGQLLDEKAIAFLAGKAKVEETTDS
jgi:trigger factor